MKTYKQLIESIVSALPRTHTGHVQDGPTNSDTDGNFQDVENPEISDRINAALAHLNRLPTSNPKQRVVEIKVALSHAGVDFDHTSVNIAEGEKSEVSAKRWGGRVGMDEDGTFINDDGFGDNPHVIQFEWTKQDHMWNLVAEMKPAILGEQMGGGMVSAPNTGVNPVSAKGFGNPSPINPGDVIPDDYNDGVNPYNWDDNPEQWQQWQDNWTTPISPMDDEGNPNPKYWD